MKVNPRGRHAVAQQQKAHASCDQEVSDNAKFPLHAGDDENCASMNTIANFYWSIPPLIASEIVSTFGSPSWDGEAGDSLSHTNCCT